MHRIKTVPQLGLEAHTTLSDVSLNCTLRIVTWCLQPTPVEQLPVLAGIPPTELRRRASSLALARRAMDPDYLLHHTITREETQPRLKSRLPFATNGKDLLSTILLNETRAHWIARMLSVELQPSTSRLREYITSPARIRPSTASLGQIQWTTHWSWALQCWYVDMGPIQKSSLRLGSRPAESKSHHHGVPLIPSTK